MIHYRAERSDDELLPFLEIPFLPNGVALLLACYLVYWENHKLTHSQNTFFWWGGGAIVTVKELLVSLFFNPLVYFLTCVPK